MVIPMSLRAAALVFGGEAIPFNATEIASGKEQERPRNTCTSTQVQV
jgi:hypothetical protein